MAMHAPGPSTAISLRGLLPEARFLGGSDILVSRCAADSRLCQPGDLFVAIAGPKSDGHDHVPQALSRGAKGVLSERPIIAPGMVTCLVDDARSAHGKVCQALAGHPSRKIAIVGVTGTNGKTTTAHLIHSIFTAAGIRAGLLGTLGYHDGVETENASLTTPSAPLLAHWLGRMATTGCTHAVMEVSSHALAQRRVAGIEFDAACVTNVRRDHLDFHNSLEAYRAAKARLFEQVRPEGVAILNGDDAVCQDYLTKIEQPTLTVSLSGEGPINATVIDRCLSEQTFLLHCGDETVPVRTVMIGDHHVSNCLVAAALAMAYGIDLATIVRGLESVGHLPGRMERIECGQPFGVFVDYAHTPDALAHSLATLREQCEGRLICVYGAGGDRDRGKRKPMGRVVEEHADVRIVTTDNPRGESAQAIAAELISGCAHPADTLRIADRAEAIYHALKSAEPGDCVLIAGKGHETTQIIGSKRFAHDDADTARRWLYNLESAAPDFDQPWLRVSNS